VTGSVTSSSATLTVVAGGTTAVVEAHFEGTADGFAYADDLFRGTNQPTFASGALLGTGGFAGGGLQVLVGGINSSNTPNISGGWQRGFALGSSALATLTFRYQLTSANLDSNELSEVLVSVDGVLYGIPPNSFVTQLVGTGGTVTTGWQQVQIDLGTLAAGNHVLALGSYLNRKTSTNETAEVVIDDVILTVAQ
jgi:hypothetical protein